MNKFINSSIGILRTLGFLEGTSLLLLFFIAMPLKYGFDYPVLVQWIGLAHGILFVLFVAYSLLVSIQQKWSFVKTTWKVILSSFIPFGTFYIDKTILSKME